MKNMRNLSKEDRLALIIARGETSDHSHVVCGEDVRVERDSDGNSTIHVGPNGALLRHISESRFLETGEEVWTGEHHDVKIEPGVYKSVIQTEFNPMNDMIQQVKD